MKLAHQARSTRLQTMPSLPQPSGIAFCLLGLMTASASEIRVRPSDAASGTPLARAIAGAKEGDTLVLEPGVYREQVRVEKPLTLRGGKGVILDGSETLKAAWTPAEGLEGTFTAEFKSRPEGLLADGRFIAEIRHDRAQKEGDWHWRTLFRKGTPLGGFTQVRAVWMHHPKEKRVYLKFGNGRPPESEALSILKSGRPIIEVAARDVVLENLTLCGGSEAVRLGGGAVNTRVRRCRITSYEDTGVLITGGASGCTVEACDITRGAYEEWRPTNEKRRENYEIWRIHKDVGRYDRVGISLIHAGHGNRILNNHLDRVFDGVCLGDSGAESLDKPLPDPGHGRGTEIAGNVIENTRDSGIELGVGCIDVNVHHNTLRHTHGGLRFKLPRIGPVFIHHNRLGEGTPFNIWFSMDSSPAEGYIYHNTIEGGDDAALAYSSFNRQRSFATPKWHVLNNLVLGVRDGFFQANKNTPPRDFIESNNIVAEDAAAAIDAGRDLSTYFKGGPLPGCERGSFKGSAPDAGAEEH